MEMEEIEYLEELEDFILPNGDLAVGASEGVNYQKLNTPQNMTVNTVLATKPPQILRHSEIAVSTVKQQLIPKKQIPSTLMMQTNLNSSSSSCRKQNKITQKPTNHSKPQILRSKQKPSNISQVMSTERSIEANNSSKPKTFSTQKRTEQKESNNAISNRQEALYDDPLSLDTDDAFLDFDDDKNDFLDNFEYDFEVDNFNTGEISDVDTDLAEFSDKFGEENFRFETDISYECFDTLNEKQANKIKKPAKKGEQMEKHGLNSNCIYSKHKSDQMNLAKSDGLQHLKEGANKQKHSSNELNDSTKIVRYIQFTKEKLNSNGKKSETTPQKKKVPSKLKTKLLSNESPQLCEVTPNPNDCNEQVSHVATNSTKTYMNPNSNGIICKKQMTNRNNKNITDLKLNANHGRNSTNGKISLPEGTKNKKEGKSQLSNECQNSNSVSDSPELSKTPEYNSDYLKEKVTSESKKIKIKFGSLYLKSIKPPYSNKSVPRSVSQNCSSTVEESTLTSPTTILKENGEIKDTYISMPYVKNKTFFYEPNFFYDFCQTKVPFTYDENKLNNKTNEVKASTSEDEKKRYSLTPEKKSISEDEEKLNDNIKETCSISNDIALEKSKKTIESGVSSQLDNQSISSTKDDVRLEESVSKAQLPENTISDSGTLKSANKLKARSLKIRLNKSTVNKFIRSFKSCLEPSKSSTILQRLDNKSKISFKRKMIPVSNTESSTSNPSNSSEKILNSQEHIPSKTPGKISAKPTIISTESKIPAKAITLSKQFEVPVKETVISTDPEVHANIPVKKSEKELRTLKRTDTLEASLSALSKRKKRKIEEKQECTNLLPLNSELLISKKLPTKSKVESKKEDNAQANNNKSGVGNKTAINSNTQATLNTVNSNHKKLNDSYSTSTEINQKDKPILRKVVKKKNVKRSKNAELCSTPVISSKESEFTRKQTDQTLHQEPEISTGASINYESIVQDGKKKNDLKQTSISTSRIELIQPKSELSLDAYKNLIAQNSSNCVNNEQFKRNHKTYFMTKPHDKNNIVLETLKNTFKTYSTNCRNETEFTVFELPTFIVMKTKIVTRKDLHGDKACIPPIIKDKIDKLPEESQQIPNLKTERLEFKDVCLDINTLLGEDANYLKFASRSERESRMNQVLEDVSLSLEDAQCALKFLQSYLSIHTKDIREKSKNQKFIPIYDSQKKIIGYRKRKINKKKQPELNEKNKHTRSDQKTSICAPTSDSVTNAINFSVVNVRTIPTLPPSENTDITTKNEPLVTDGTEEEMIIPDMSPANNTKSIKNEWETPGQ